MDLQHLSFKLFVEPSAINLEEYVGIFNGWIQEQATEELLVDVADYRHVYAGPGIILVGHEANYSLDNAGNRLGLLYSRKAQVSGETRDKLTQAARAALIAARKLEREQGLKFNGQEAQVIVNDRLIAPNTPEMFAALGPELRTFFDQLYEGASYTLEHNADPRERFTVEAKASVDFDLGILLGNL